MIARLQYLLNFQTNKRNEMNKKNKNLMLEIEQDFFCTVYKCGCKRKTVRKQQKNEHDQSSVKIPPNPLLVLFW